SADPPPLPNCPHSGDPPFLLASGCLCERRRLLLASQGSRARWVSRAPCIPESHVGCHDQARKPIGPRPQIQRRRAFPPALISWCLVLRSFALVPRLAQEHHALAVVLELHARRRQTVEVHTRGGLHAARGDTVPAVQVVRTHMTLDGRLMHETARDVVE